MFWLFVDNKVIIIDIKYVYFLKGQYDPLTYVIGPSLYTELKKIYQGFGDFQIRVKKNDISWFVLKAWIVFYCIEWHIIGDFVGLGNSEFPSILLPCPFNE